MFKEIIEFDDSMSLQDMSDIMFNNYLLGDAEARDFICGDKDSASEKLRIDHLTAHVNKSVRINGLQPDNSRELAEALLRTFRGVANPEEEPKPKPKPEPKLKEPADKKK